MKTFVDCWRVNSSQFDTFVAVEAISSQHHLCSCRVQYLLLAHLPLWFKCYNNNALAKSKHTQIIEAVVVYTILVSSTMLSPFIDGQVSFSKTNQPSPTQDVHWRVSIKFSNLLSLNQQIIMSHFVIFLNTESPSHLTYRWHIYSSTVAVFIPVHSVGDESLLFATVCPFNSFPMYSLPRNMNQTESWSVSTTHYGASNGISFGST